MSLLWALPHPAQERRVAVAHAIWRHVIGRVIAVMTIGTVVLARHLRGAKIGPDCSWPFEWRIRSQYYTGRFFYNCPELVRCHRICRRVQAFYAINLSCPAKRKKTPYYGTPYHTVAFYILNEKETPYYGTPYTVAFLILNGKKDTILWHTLSYRGILYLKWKKTPYYGTPYTVAFLILNGKKTPYYYGTPYHTVAFYILNEKRHHIMAHLIIPWHSIS